MSRVLREYFKALQDNTVAAPRHFHSFRQWNQDLLPLHPLPNHGFSSHIGFDLPRMQRYPCPDLLNFPFNQRFPQIPPTLSYGLFRTQDKIITNLFRNLSPIGDILMRNFLSIRSRILAGLFRQITRSLLICLPPQPCSLETIILSRSASPEERPERHCAPSRFRRGAEKNNFPVWSLPSLPC